jgi:hypothetical protein
MKSYTIWQSADFLPNGRFREQDRKRILEILNNNDGAVRSIEDVASGFFTETKALANGYESLDDVARDLAAIANSLKTINSIIVARGIARAALQAPLISIGGLKLIRAFDDLFSGTTGAAIIMAAERAAEMHQARPSNRRGGTKPSGERAARLKLAAHVCRVANSSGITVRRNEARLIELLALTYSALGIDEINPDSDIRELLKTNSWQGFGDN